MSDTPILPTPRLQNGPKINKASPRSFIVRSLINMLGPIIGALIIARQVKTYPIYKSLVPGPKSDQHGDEYVTSENGPTTKDLLQEASILVSSIDANVTRLWQIRTVEVTIWTFALSVGLGQFSGGKISLALLLVSFGIPFVFITIDRRLNSWYLTMRKRSQQITAYINDSDRLAYLSKTGQKFPLFDPEMKFTKSGMKSAEDKPDQTGGIDWNILCFYGGQLVISAAIILFVYYGIVTGKYEGPPKPEFSPIVSDIPLVK